MKWTHLPGRLNFSRTLVQTATASLAVSVFLVSVLANAPRIRAQSTPTAAAPPPSFEVASVKADHSGTGMIRFGGPDVSRYTATNVTAQSLIEVAYDMKDFQVSGGPAWINSDKFDVDAKVEDSMAEQMQKLPVAKRQEQTRLMIQSLLADRFKLSVRKETKELPVYALVVAKGGAKLTDAVASPSDSQAKSAPSSQSPGGHAGSDPPKDPPSTVMINLGNGGKMSLTFKGSSISNLAGILSQQVGRQIVDQTGLSGKYDFTLQWTSDNTVSAFPGMPPPPVAPRSADTLDSGGTSIFTALEDQLGLKLESTKGPVDTIVIDHIEQPSEN